MSEGEPEPCTLAIRFANSESEFMRWGVWNCGAVTLTGPLDANLFKEAFIKAQQENEALFKTDAEEVGTETKEAPAAAE